MVNVGLSPGSILGIVVAVAGALLYFLRSWRPELARDSDIFFAAVGLLCGGILFFNGWRLDPILMFGQLLLTGSAGFFAIESIRMRRVATEQARRNTPIVDDDRPVSRVYRAEIDELDSLDEDEDYPPVRRIRSARDGSGRGQTAYVDELEEETRSSRRLNPRRPSSNRPTSDRPTNTNPKRRSPRPDDSYTDSGSGYSNGFDEPTSDRPRRSRPNPNRPSSDRPASDRPNSESSSTRTTRKRPRPDRPASPSEGDYVDYQPVDEKAYKSYTNNESDNSSNFDDDF
jgi:Ycf66 protein N-terminus